MKSNYYAVVTGLALLCAIVMFLFLIDRYPTFYCDEPFFNASAARYVSGQDFNYVLHSEAPHDNQIWAHHGPFYFRMQVPVFRLLGVSYFSSRIPGYLSGHLAIVLLCVFLLRKRYALYAMILSLCWLGDPISLQLHLGRPEGLGMLFSSLGFICLVNALSGKTSLWYAGTSLFIGMAVGFNPGAVFFALAAVAAVVLLRCRSGLADPIKYLSIGAIVPVLLMLLCWLPNIADAIEQLAWYVRFSTTTASGNKLFRLREMLLSGDLAVYWGLCLNLIAIGFLLPAWIKKCITTEERDVGFVLGIVSMCFSLAGVMIYLGSSMNLYYQLHIVPWPLISALFLFDKKDMVISCKSVVVAVCALLLLASWSVGSLWKLTRFREAIIYYDELERGELNLEVSNAIPEGANVYGDPVFYASVIQVTRAFTPLNFFSNDEGGIVPDDAWLVIHPRYDDILDKTDPTIRSARTLVASGILFKEARGLQESYQIYGPKGVE